MPISRAYQGMPNGDMLNIMVRISDAGNGVPKTPGKSVFVCFEFNPTMLKL
jgi:hypothetical protein